ncbi:MAG: efflux RND transporter periplasmic adaptor subunit [Xanthomonadales bacterium]|nr:efflux RND transporter periplasmic adaptor subunit [Xanthomonadales bacterium]
MPAPRSSGFRLARLIPVAVVIALLAAAAWWWQGRDQAGEQRYRTAAVESGDIRVAISATGTLSALSTVDVGSEVSGKVTEVLVDYNDHVRKGQVIARIDPDTFTTQIAQGDAAIASARAALANAQATLRNAEADYARKRDLAQRKLVAKSDLDLAQAQRDQARAQVAQNEAQIRQQQASTENAHLNLARSVIRSPVDGVVLTRAVEPGQTVAASLQAPVLFKIAEDLSRMEILLAVDESDIGQVRPGLPVSFTVDAFPDRRFRGEVRQVRLSATNTNNVVTYPVVVSVDNADQSLLPGLTANAEIEVSRRDDVLKVPNAALRYKPTGEAAAAAATPDAAAGQRSGGMNDELPKIAASLKLDPAQQAAFDDALAKLRERMAARMAAVAQQQGQNGGGSALFGRPPGGGGPGGGASQANGNDPAARQRRLERINQQFGAFRDGLRDDQRKVWDDGLNALVSARRAPLYVLADGKPKQVMVRVGASDDTSTEIDGGLKAGDQVIVGVQTGEAPK